MAEENGDAKGHGRIEIFAALLLALGVVATAWSSYQANRWHGEQAKATSVTNATRSRAVRASNEADALRSVDIATFIQWVDAQAHDDSELTDFYETRFRDEFRPAFDAWIAQDPFDNPDAPLSPFAIPEYRIETKKEVARLDRAAEASAAVVRRDIQYASNYVLAVVLFAIALFFGGISTKLKDRRTEKLIVTAGWVVLIGGVAWIATFPVSMTV